jgi:PEP-CTERM motif
MADAVSLGVAVLVGCGLFAPPAQAGYAVTLEQVGRNVVATGSGPIDLTGLTSAGPGLSGARVFPEGAEIITGPVGSEGLLRSDLYTGYTGPTSFGSGGETIPNTSGSGDIVGIGMFGMDLVVPSGYASGSALSDTATYINQTFASLGVIPGTYLWTWGSGASGDTFSLQIGPDTAVPEPASLTLLGVGLAGLGVVRRRTQQQPVPRFSMPS